MKFRLEINQKEVVEAGIKGVKIQEWLIFDVVRHMIGADWTKKITEHEKSYAWISEQSILDQIPLLELSRRQVHRLVDNLVEAGLLVRFAGNKGKKRVYLGLTPIGDSLGRHSMTNMAISDDGVCQKWQSENDKSGNLRMTEMSEDNNIKNKIIKDNTSPTPSDAVSPSEPETKTKRVRKARLTRSDVLSFYENEKRKSLETPLPKDLDAAAAAWRIPGEEVMKKLAAGYSEVVDFMLEPSDMWPQGMWRCVLTKPDQLEFLQFCRLVLQFGMTRAEIKENLTSWENKKYDNDNLYATLYTWKIKPRKQSYSEAMPPSGQARTGLSIPKPVRQ